MRPSQALGRGAQRRVRGVAVSVKTRRIRSALFKLGWCRNARPDDRFSWFTMPAKAADNGGRLAKRIPWIPSSRRAVRRDIGRVKGHVLSCGSRSRAASGATTRSRSRFVSPTENGRRARSSLTTPSEPEPIILALECKGLMNEYRQGMKCVVLVLVIKLIIHQNSEIRPTLETWPPSPLGG
jgi:hypothetical protein